MVVGQGFPVGQQQHARGGGKHRDFFFQPLRRLGVGGQHQQRQAGFDLGGQQAGVGAGAERAQTVFLAGTKRGKQGSRHGLGHNNKKDAIVAQPGNVLRVPDIGSP